MNEAKNAQIISIADTRINVGHDQFNGVFFSFKT